MSLLVAFSGQGSQHSEMFKLLSADAFGKIWLQEASDILHVNLFDEVSVEKACCDVIQVQCLIVVLSVGVFYALKKQATIRPAFMCGYSLGEVSAFCASTNMCLTNICELVKKRARFMQQANTSVGGLAALKGNINLQQVQELVENYACYIAIINGDDHYIIGGRESDIDAALMAARANGVAKVERLAVKLPSHTPLLAKATTKFAVYLQHFNPVEMQYPILNALTQELIFNAKDMLPILAKELSETLHWDSVMHIAAEYGSLCFLELGPGASLRNLAKSTMPILKAYQMEGFSSLNGLAEVVNKASA